MKVAIIGGGYAGMAAAVTLAQAGAAPTVYETATELGGRARRVRFRDAVLDNGVHILLGAYRETLHLMRLVGQDPASALLRLPLDWRVDDVFRLKSVSLPAPLHLAVGLLCARGASWKERYAAARFIGAARRIRFRLAADVSVDELLQQHQQGAAFTRRLWHPLCLAALNTPPDIASGQVFLNVLRDGLAAKRDACDVLLARVDLTELFPAPAASFVRARGGTLITGRPVHRITREVSGYLVDAGGEQVHHTHVICAVGPHQASTIVPQAAELDAVSRMVADLRYQPIYTIYLQFDRVVDLRAPMLGLRDGVGQWVFDRGAIAGQEGLVAVVVSATGDHMRLTQPQLAQQICAQLRRELGPLPPLRWHRVIAEKRATFGCTVGVQRPPRRSPLPNFLLAGDYTAGDYPATLEAAVQSGVACARAILG